MTTTTIPILELLRQRWQAKALADEAAARVKALDDQILAHQRDGHLDQYKDGKSYQLPGWKVQLVSRKTKTYGDETKRAVKALQEQAELEGDVTTKTTEYLRIDSTGSDEDF